MTDSLRTATLLPTDPAGRAVIAKFFRALGDPTRLRLLEFVLQEEKTVTHSDSPHHDGPPAPLGANGPSRSCRATT